MAKIETQEQVNWTLLGIVWGLIVSLFGGFFTWIHLYFKERANESNEKITLKINEIALPKFAEQDKKIEERLNRFEAKLDKVYELLMEDKK
jgi:hypothetical protein